MRGCDWRRIFVRSETVRSASARSARTRRRVPSPAARPQHARRLADGACAVFKEVQHLMDDDDVERVARQREIIDVAMAHAAMPVPGAVEPLARQRQHVERQIEPEAALDVA